MKKTIFTVTPKMFFNPNVPVDEEIRQAALWKQAQRDSEARARKLINEWKREMMPVKMKDEVTPEMIERAKEYPIESLVAIPRNNAICCLWHDEKTPSLHLSKHNRLRCYGACGKSFDSIDTYRQIHGVTFHEAVRSLQ
jgi:hypothetical protein